MSELIGLVASGATLFVAGLGLAAALLLLALAMLSFCWDALPRNHPAPAVNRDGDA